MVSGRGGTRDDVADDQALMERLTKRDASAVAALYDRHASLLYGLILRIIRQRSEAEEVLQEVFVAAWTRANTYNRELGPPVAWLLRIARNRAVDRLRANAVRLKAAESAAGSDGPPATPEAAAAASQRQAAVRRALDTLPTEQRELIEQAYFLGLTQTELAERHRLPLGTVKTRVRSGMLSLRQQLAEMGEA
jgi:RNA polymerase sigma-70 factor, ECF subfamily